MIMIDDKSLKEEVLVLEKEISKEEEINDRPNSN